MEKRYVVNLFTLTYFVSFQIMAMELKLSDTQDKLDKIIIEKDRLVMEKLALERQVNLFFFHHFYCCFKALLAKNGL